MVRPLPRTRRFPATGAVIAAGLLLGGCELPGFGAPDPAAEEGESIWRLWQGFFIAGLLVAALVWGLLIYVLVRFRRRRHDDGTELPNQNAYNIPLEIFYTAVPVLVVGGLFGVSVATQERVNRLADDPAVTVDVVGFQWSWEFHYVDEDLTIAGGSGLDELPELVLPVDQVVHLRLDADDVNHSFWVPDFLSKRDLIPGLTNEIQVTPTETGSYVGRCAEYCGIDHWRMLYTVRVVSQDEYEDWLADARAGAEAEDRRDTEDDPASQDDNVDEGGADTEPGEEPAGTDDQDDPGEQDNQTGDTEGQNPAGGANQGGGS